MTAEQRDAAAIDLSTTDVLAANRARVIAQQEIALQCWAAEKAKRDAAMAAPAEPCAAPPRPKRRAEHLEWLAPASVKRKVAAPVRLGVVPLDKELERQLVADEAAERRAMRRAPAAPPRRTSARRAPAILSMYELEKLLFPSPAELEQSRRGVIRD